MNTQRLNVMALFALCVFALWQTTVRADEQVVTTFDRWYVLEMAGEHAGYAHSTERHKDGRIVTQTDMKLSVRRGNQPITIQHEMWFVETEEGRPIEASSTLVPGIGAATANLGQVAIQQHARFTDTGVDITTGQGPTARTVTHPLLDEAFLPPAAAQRIIEQRMAEGAQEMSVGLIDASMGITPLRMEMKIIGEENVEVFGKVVPAVVWEASASNMPGLTVREFVDEHGRALKTTVQFMPGMDIAMIEADEQLAKAEVDPPQVMAQTLIRPDKPIANARDSRSAIYRVTVAGNGDTPFTLPRTGYQRIVWDDQRTAAVVLDLGQPVNAVDDLPTDADLESSDMIDHESKAVRDLLAKALKDVDANAPDHEVASRLRAFVHGYIDEKDLSVGLARAGQIARTAQGDCTEHAVLLAALLRAKDIPARTVTGLIYVDQFLGREGVFGYHMWTQAWLTDSGDGGGAGGRWVDLDAVLDGRDFDAAHIALAVSSMADGQMVNDLVAMLPTFGRLNIQVVSAE
jgi:hypothetical protein